MEKDMRKSRVALVKCESYEQEKVDMAVRKAAELLGGLEEILGCVEKESRLVIKPNLLAKCPPEKACTTHPAVFRAVGRLLQEAGFSNLKYGDSPGNPMIRPERIAEECGLKEAADSLGIPFGNFEEGETVGFPQGRVADRFVICREILDADGIINVCKMKTHQLERITGAVKNTFGCVFGVNKASSHAKFSTAETFAKMVADLNALVSPKLHVMDGILAMEGNGPQSGDPVKMNVILMSLDPVAMDSLFCHLVDLRPELAPTNAAAAEAGLGTYESVTVVTEEGEMTLREAAEKYGNSDFNVQRGKEYKGTLHSIRFLMPLLQKKPVVREDRCIGCGICVSSCPVEGKAIHIGKDGIGGKSQGKAYYDYGKCIKCYCCQEMCPEDAITVKKSLLAKIADRKWNI